MFPFDSKGGRGEGRTELLGGLEGERKKGAAGGGTEGEEGRGMGMGGRGDGDKRRKAVFLEVKSGEKGEERR